MLTDHTPTLTRNARRSSRFSPVVALRWAIPLFLLIALASPLLAQVGPGAAEPKSTVKTVFDSFFKSPDFFGTFMIWTLILMSVTVVSLSIQAWMSNRRSQVLPPALVAEYAELIDEKKYKEAMEKAALDRTVFGQVLHGALQQASQGYGAIERAVEEYADAIGSQRIRKLEYLNILGNVGPMVGLFGTVYGMIIAFQAIVTAGGQPKPAELAGGVSTALVNTFWGLVVGIPALVNAALVRNHIDGLMVEVMIASESIISRFRPVRKPEKPAAPSAPPVARPRPAVATETRR